MEQFPNTDIDQTLIDKIVCEVKSHGLFDQFRRECMADVDTKPAYQNLQHRVETTINNFLKEQKWTPELNKNQLREKLRKFVTEKGFLDTGVERIVDQVVNPKINSNFLPKIEDVSYQFMGIEKPTKKPNQFDDDIPLPVDPSMGFLPNLDLEQVSPESEKSPSLTSKSPKYEVENINIMDESDDKMEDFESPAFEPLEGYSKKNDECDEEETIEEIKTEIIYDEQEKPEDENKDLVEQGTDNSNNHENNVTDNISYNNNINVNNTNNDEVKSNLSSISGLTSNESLNESLDGEPVNVEENPVSKNCELTDVNHDINPRMTESNTELSSSVPEIQAPSEVKDEKEEEKVTKEGAIEEQEEVNKESKETRSDVRAVLQPQEVKMDLGEIQPSSNIFVTNDTELALENNDSELSQVSSSSRLSIVTNNNTNTRMDGDTNETGAVKNNEQLKFFNSSRDICPYGISEEAQMQRFNDSSSSENSLIINENTSDSTCQNGNKEQFITNFDINKDEIKFEGTERKSFDIDLNPKQPFDENDTLKHIDNIMNYKTNQKTDQDEVFKIESNGANELNKDATQMLVTGSKSEANDSNTSEKSVYKSKENSSNGNKSDCKTSRAASENQSSDKGRSRDRSTSSHHHSRDRHRSHSEREKDRSREKDRDRDRDKKYSSASRSNSTTKDRSKISREESHDNDADRKREGSSNSSSKYRYDDKNKSSRPSSSSSHSSSKRDRDHHRDRERSKSERSSSSNSNRRDQSSNHHLSSSLHSRDRDRDRDRYRHHSDSKKPPSSTSSSSKKDDHYLYREKSSSRQRSRSRDSNDGSTYYNNTASRTNLISNNESSGNQTAINSQTTIKDQSEQIKTATLSNKQGSDSPNMVIDETTTDSNQETVLISTVAEDTTALQFLLRSRPLLNDNDGEAEFVLPAKPVVVDQILTGNELNLEMFIGENRNDPVVSSIERSLSTQVKKPKVADNIHEARKFMKLRKQIEREEQKKLEQARVLAKQYIRTNAAAVNDDGQGVEIEFACVNPGNGTKITGPTISSPLKFINGIEIDDKLIPSNEDRTIIATKTSTITNPREAISNSSSIRNETKPNAAPEKSIHSDSNSFYGFEKDSVSEMIEKLDRLANYINSKINKSTSPKATNKLPILKKAVIELFPLDLEFKRKNGQFKETFNLTDLSESVNHKLFFENNKIADERDLLKKQSMTESRKRKHARYSPSSSQDDTIDAEVTKAFIAQTPDDTDEINLQTVKHNNNTVPSKPKHTSKARYSPDDLFKPRPVCGGSRSRRRGINCND